jgi:hypothetical protein
MSISKLGMIHHNIAFEIFTLAFEFNLTDLYGKICILHFKAKYKLETIEILVVKKDKIENQKMPLFD